MKIIEIKNTREGEVAYILDEERGRVMKVLVDDYTGYNEAEEIDLPPVRRPAKKVLKRELPEDNVEEEIPTEKEKPPVRRQSGPSIIPPHLRGVFMKPGMPGAAEERRDVM